MEHAFYALRRIDQIGNRSRHHTHEKGQENPDGDSRQGRCRRMSPQNGKQNGQPQPEGNIKYRKKQKRRNTKHFLNRRRKPDGKQSDGAHQYPQGKHHHKNGRKACHKFPINDCIPVNGL